MTAQITERLRLLVVIGCLVAAFPATASADTFRGETSQGKRATVRTNNSGILLALLAALGPGLWLLGIAAAIYLIIGWLS